MQPQIQRLEAFSVAGLTARTGNHAEGKLPVARIGMLWDRFFDERVYQTVPNRTYDMRLYGVYSDYEAEANGAFAVTTGVAVSGGPSAVQIDGGDYLVFTGEGQMPQMALAVWQAIWQYFDEHPEVRRRYRSDFEAYSGPEQVAIHIGVILN
jgi:predicted transcriptional regulator YdeE